MVKINVKSSAIRYTSEHIDADYDYQTSVVRDCGNDEVEVTPQTTRVTLRTLAKVPRTGVMLVGWGGNNGSTITAAILANRRKLTWRTKEGLKVSNYFGSITQASTVSLGHDSKGEEIFAPMKDLVPMLEPNDIILDGWDISSMNLADAMERAKVLDWEVQKQLRSDMEKLRPRPGIYDKDFIAANQEDRADNVILGTKQEQMEKIRKDIRDFKSKNNLDKVIVLWTANTERFAEIVPGVNDTADNLLASIKRGESEVSPSTLFAVACCLEGVTYINGSPQNTFVPGMLELAERQGTFIAGDDFKSGQTKFKSVLVDFLVSAGIKPVSIVSYNHLGNNDGKNLSAPAQFRSKEISKSNVVDDMVASNRILFPSPKEDKPDHCVVIKYVPYVGDSKRAMDEYTSELMMGGKNTIVVHNTCEDSLLATPIILDLIILGELCERVQMRFAGSQKFQPFNSILTLLSYMCKAPLVPKGAPLVNALFKQRAAVENFLRACIALPPINHMDLEFKLSDAEQWVNAQKIPQTQEDVIIQKTTFVAREGIRTA